MNDVVKEIKGVMKHNWGCGEGGTTTLGQVVRRGLLEEVTFEQALKAKEPASSSLALWDLGLCLSQFLSESLSQGSNNC